MSQVLIYLSDFEKYKIPNCGTDGPYANVESFIPLSRKSQKGSPPCPPCTLKMSPSSINHCILWTLDHFGKYYNKNIINVKNLNSENTKYYNDINKITDLNSILSI